MRRLSISILVAVLLTPVLLAGCIVEALEGSGNLKTEEMTFTEFTKVEIGSAFEAEIIQADSYRVSITADDNMFEYIQLSKGGKTLKISLKTANYINTTQKVKITMPRLRALKLSGATWGSVAGFSSTENADFEVSGASSLDLTEMSAGDVDFEVSGASKVAGKITADDIDFDISGASNVQLEGSAKDIAIKASGASRAELADFPVNNADVNFSGASTGTVNMDGKLDANLSGASKLRYIGEPTMGDINISSGSTLSRK